MSDVPRPGRLLARAALGGVRAALPGAGQRPTTLADAPTAAAQVLVDADRAAAYARAVGAGVGGPVPPLLPHVLGFPLQLDLLTSAAAPFPLLGLVHVAQSATVHAPVRVGESLELAASLEDLRPHPSGRVLDAVLLAHRGGELVWEGRSTYLRRGPDGEDDATVPGPADAPGRAADAVRIDVPADTGRRYARVSGDANPIHLSAVTARAFGFPSAIAHGMWTLARVLAALEGRVPPTLAVDARFEKPIRLPARTSLTAERDDRPGAWTLALHDRRRPDLRHCTATVRPA